MSESQLPTRRQKNRPAGVKYWRNKADQAVAEYHRKRGTIDAPIMRAPPLTTAEKIAKHQLQRTAKRMGINT